MQGFTIQNYKKGYERDQARIGIAVAREWIWPYAYDLKDLTEPVSQPDFDPDTLLYCLLVDEIVGYLLFTIDAKNQ